MVRVRPRDVGRVHTYSARHLTMVYRCSPASYALVATALAPLLDR
jgi:hypothetical protein